MKTKVRITFPQYQVYLLKEEEMGFSCRWLLPAENWTSHMLGTCWADPLHRGLLPPWGLGEGCHQETSLIWPTDHYLLLLFHVGGDEAATYSLKAIKSQICPFQIKWFHASPGERIGAGPISGSHPLLCRTVLCFFTMTWGYTKYTQYQRLMRVISFIVFSSLAAVSGQKFAFTLCILIQPLLWHRFQFNQS